MHFAHYYHPVPHPNSKFCMKPWLTAGLKGYTYYWQCLALVTISLTCTLSSYHHCMRAFQRNRCHPQIVAAPWIVGTQNEKKSSSRGVWSKKYSIQTICSSKSLPPVYKSFDLCFLFLQAVVGTTIAGEMKTDFVSVVTLLILIAVVPAGKLTFTFKVGR